MPVNGSDDLCGDVEKSWMRMVIIFWNAVRR